VPVPGLFDSDIEAAVARDEFLIRCQLSPPPLLLVRNHFL
jgi:hypothetical protein